jgi:hypothetical protein
MEFIEKLYPKKHWQQCLVESWLFLLIEWLTGIWGSLPLPRITRTNHTTCTSLGKKQNSKVEVWSLLKCVASTPL